MVKVSHALNHSATEARRLQETRETTAMMGGLPEYIYLRKVEEEEKGKQQREMEEN